MTVQSIARTPAGAPAAGSPAPFLQLDDIGISYDSRTAVERIDLTVGESEFVSVIGPSGCGKSTLLHVLSGLNTPQRGSVRLRSADITSEVGAHLRAGYVFQDHRLLPWRTVTQNIEIAMKAAGVPKVEWAQRIQRYLTLLHVADHAQAWPMSLSGGQRQRVSIARALAVDPDMVLMDEPFSGLDEVTGRTIRVQLDALRVTSRTPTIFVTHSIREALYLSDRVLVLSRGPARVLREVVVPLERPRTYGDPRLAELEATLIEQVLDDWEIETPAAGS